MSCKIRLSCVCWIYSSIYPRILSILARQWVFVWRYYLNFQGRHTPIIKLTISAHFDFPLFAAPSFLTPRHKLKNYSRTLCRIQYNRVAGSNIVKIFNRVDWWQVYGRCSMVIIVIDLLIHHNFSTLQIFVAYIVIDRVILNLFQ